MSLVSQISTYLRGANEELRKVVWPSREETVRTSVAVITISAGVAAFFYVLDLVFNYVLGKLI